MNRLSSILGSLAVIIIAAVFILQFRPASQANSSSGPTCAVKIGAHCITDLHYWAAYRLVLGRAGDSPRIKEPRKLAADGLIERHLLNQDAKRLGVTISDDEITKELAAGRFRVSLPVEAAREKGTYLGLIPYQVSGPASDDLIRMVSVTNPKTKKFDAKVYEKEIRFISKMSPTDFREFEREEMIAARMRDLVRSRVRIGESEAKQVFTEEKSTAVIQSISFDKRFYQDLLIDKSDKAMAAWAIANKEELEKAWQSRKSQFMPECRVMKHVLVKVDSDASDEIKASAKAKIQAALTRINEGEDFAKVAKDVSEDSSASDGGDLGCVTKGRMVKPFEDAAFALEAGKVSAIVETQFGYHVIKVEKIAKEADAEKLGRDQILRDLFQSKEADRLASEGAKQVLTLLRDGKNMEDALAAYMKDLFPQSDKDKEKGKKKDDAKDAKEKKDETDTKSSEAITKDTHPYRPAIIPSAPFNISGDPIADAAPGKDIAKMAFELTKPGEVYKEAVALRNGYAIFQLKEKTPATDEEWAKNRDLYYSKMRAEKQQDALVAYVRELRKKAEPEIKYEPKIIEEPKDKKAKPEDLEMPEDE